MEIRDPEIEAQEIFRNFKRVPEDRKERASADLLLAEAGDDAESLAAAQAMIDFFGAQLRNVWRWKGGRDWLANGQFASSIMNPKEYQQRISGAISFKVAS